MIRDETHKISLVFEDKQPMNALAEMEAASNKAEKALKKLENAGQKGTEAWVKAKKAALEASVAMEKQSKSIELSDKTMGQLKNTVDKLTKELAGLKPGTEAFIAKAKELGVARKYYDDVKKSVEGLSGGLVATGKDAKLATDALMKMDKSKMSMEQLKQVIDVLNKDLAKLPPNSQAFINKAKELGEAQKHYDGVKKRVDALASGLIETQRKAALATAELMKMDKSKMSVEQLKQVMDVLNKEVTKLTPGTKAFIDKSKELQQTKKIYGDVQKTIDGVNDELEDAKKKAQKAREELLSMDRSKMTMEQLRTVIGIMNSNLAKLPPNTKAFVDEAKKISEAEKHLKQASDQVQNIQKGGEALAKPTMWDKISGGVNKVNLAFKAMIALQVVQWAVDLGKSIFGTTQKLEKYETVLGTALKSQKLAKESMTALKDIAAKTPFSVDVLTEAYVKMVNRGLRPTREQMLSMGDVASALGKPLEAVNEAILDVSNTERWNELGIKVQKSGDKIIGTFKGQKVTMDATEEGALKMVAAFGKMEGVAGQNAEMMTKLEGQTSNLGDTFMQLAGAVGEQLKPLFYALLGVVIQVANFLLELAKNSEPVVVVFKTLWTQVTNVFDSLMGLVLQVFPSLNKQTVSASGVMKTLGVAFQNILLPLKLALTGVQAIIDAMATLFNGGKALVKFLQGDFAGASKAWDATKVQATKMKDHVVGNFEEIKKGYKAAMVDNPKKLEPEAVLAAATTEGKKQKSMTEEQKKAAEKREKEAEKNRKKEEKAEEKHLQNVAKANEEALKKIAEYEAETDITSIKDELEREIAKIDEKARKRKTEVNETLADEKLKEKQRTAIDKEAEAERQKIRDDYKAKEAKKQEEAASKRLENNKFVIEQERKAESALLDWKELQAGNNAHKLAEIKKERLNLELKYTKEKLDAELAAEKAKAEREITNADDKEKTLKALENRYNNEKKAQTEKYSQDISKIDKDLTDGKASKQKAWSDVFSNFLKGDVSGAIDAANQIVKGELSAWQKRLQKNMEMFNMVGQMAQQAASFLADVEKAKADKAIAEAIRERDEKVAILQQQLDKNSADLNAALDKEKAVKDQQSTAIKDLKEAETNRIKDLEKILSDDTMDKADKIKALKENYSSEFLNMKDAETEKVKALKEAETEKLQNLEQTLNENIWDLESQLRVTTDKAERAALEEKIRKANQEKTEKMDAAEKTMKAVIKAAESERDAKIAAGEKTLKTKVAELTDETKQDKALSKDRIAQAKAEMDAKVKAAEKEKEEKVKAATDEKNRQIRIKKDLEAAVKAENDRARETERREKLKAWEAQKKADIASALITGALATIKALASGLWPVNLVFAAMSAVMTGIQVAKIKSQPQPTFHYGFTPQGSKHETTYGRGGIALIDNKTGRDLGEMEGGEAIVNAEQTEINQPIIQQMHENAKRGIKKPVWETMKARKSLAFRDGIPSFKSPAFEGRMYQYGTVLGKRRFADGTDSFTSDGMVNTSSAEVQRSKELSEEQIKILREQNESLKRIVEQNDLGNVYQYQTRDAVNRNVDATKSVENAIRQGAISQKLDVMIRLISGLGVRK